MGRSQETFNKKEVRKKIKLGESYPILLFFYISGVIETSNNDDRKAITKMD